MTKIEVADLVQLTSLPLEIVGLTLTIIEVFYQHKHEKFQNGFTRFLERSIELQRKYNKAYFWLVFIPLSIALLITAYAPEELIITVLATYICYLFLILVLAQMAYSTLCIFLPGRNLLAFGITLSIVGLIGECYQVFSLLNKFTA